MKDLDSREYDISEIDEDPRFAQARKEALFVQVFFTAAIFVVILVCFLTGRGDPNEMTFFFGWPMWYVYGFLTAVAAIVIGLVWLNKGFKKHSLEAIADDKEED